MPGSNQIRTWDFNTDYKPINSNRKSIQFVLDSSLTFKFVLNVMYEKGEGENRNIPLQANAYMLGFISGIDCHPSFIHISRSMEDDQHQYHVVASTQWKLLGATIYTRWKTYEGNLSVK